MCGIVYCHDFDGKAVNNGILNIFDKQRGRGTQGFGLFDGQEGNMVRSASEDKILDWLCKYDSNLILFHHRYPTSTTNTKNTAHPLSTRKHFGNRQYIMVHNGHISNSHSLKIEHEKLGIKYKAIDGARFNDSEALLWDLSLYLEGKQTKLEAYGAMAFICLRLTDGVLDRMYFGRNTNPLNMLRVKQGLMLSSEGSGSAIDTHTLYTWNYKLKRLNSKKLAMPSWSSDYERSSDYESSYDYTSKDYPGYVWTPRVTRDSDYKERYVYTEEEDDYGLEADYGLANEDDWETPEVEGVVMNYLKNAKGVIQLAYDELEFDYMQIAEDVQTKEDYNALLLFERALKFLETDQEWLDPQSVSSWWVDEMLDEAMAKKEQRQLMLREGV